MHRRSLSDLQGVSTLQGASTQRTTQDRRSAPRRGSRCFCMPTGACLWAWLLLGTLVVPGAWSFLSEEQEEMLVELHNHYRGLVSPSASAMLPLRWDPTLKVVAESYASKCIWNHNPELEDTGENLFAGTGPLDLREALEKWFLENLDYNFQNNSCDEDKMCGHYTQMVWAGTHRVGCAFHLCNSMEGLDWERVSFLVCNYYPAGNYEDERPYVEGDWCSRCPENLQICENNLCVAEMADEDEEEDEEVTVIVPPEATSEPTFQLAEEEEEKEVVPPPATRGPYIQPASTISAGTTSAWDSEGTQPEATPPEGTHPPTVDSTPQDEEEMVTVQVTEEEKRKESGDKMEGQEKRDVAVKIYRNQKGLLSSGSVSSACLLLVCLTGILCLRL